MYYNKFINSFKSISQPFLLRMADIVFIYISFYYLLFKIFLIYSFMYIFMHRLIQRIMYSFTYLVPVK